MDLDEAAHAFREFVAVVKALRTPGTGCPWDLEQNHHSLRPYLIEEAYEVLDALDRGNDPAFREELGDLLLQVVLHAQLAADRGAFSITEVVRGIAEKMVRRHPHVFGGVQVSGSAEVVRNWEQIKAAEAQGAGREAPHAGLDRVPESLPALLRAQRLGEKAAKVGFDSASVSAILDKVREAFAQFERELQCAADRRTLAALTPLEAAQSVSEEQRQRLGHELGDVLFSMCQLARWLGVSPEDSLRACSRRFVEHLRPAKEKETTP